MLGVDPSDCESAFYLTKTDQTATNRGVDLADTQFSNSIIPADGGFESLQGLMGEKERAQQEIEKIKRNASLTATDREKAMRSVKSLTRTIDSLIGREKDKISEHYES